MPLSVTLTTAQFPLRAIRSSNPSASLGVLGRIRQQIRENLCKTIEITFDPKFLCARFDDEFVAVRVDGRTGGLGASSPR